MRERGRGAPPPIGRPAPYVVSASELAQNGNFADGREPWQGTALTFLESDGGAGEHGLRVSDTVVQKLAEDALEPRRSYRLLVKARVLGSAPGSIAVKFREPRSKNTFRTYRTALTSSEDREYSVEFTAPAYTRMAEIALEAGADPVVVHSVSLRMGSPLPQTEPVRSWAHSYVPDGYTMVFNDEFGGTELNRHKWFTRYISNSETLNRLNDEQDVYVDNGTHLVHDGVLSLVAKRFSGNPPHGVQYESGMIRSDWTVHYGFFEARVRMPAGRGAYPAFWLNSDVAESGRINWPPEIDIFEFVNNGKENGPDMLHLAASWMPGTPRTFIYAHPGFDPAHFDYHAPFAFDGDWHTIAVDWTPDTLTYYVDGLKIASRAFTWTHNDGVLCRPGAHPAELRNRRSLGGTARRRRKPLPAVVRYRLGARLSASMNTSADRRASSRQSAFATEDYPEYLCSPDPDKTLTAWSNVPC